MGILDKVKKTDAKKTAPRKKKAEVQEVIAAEVKKPDTAKATVSEAAFILVRPIVSEKTTMNEAKNTYTFEVAKNATKIDVQRAVEAVYGVKPAAVRMINVEGKVVRFGRTIGRRSDWKKAMVTLPAGKTISIHEGV